MKVQDTTGKERIAQRCLTCGRDREGIVTRRDGELRVRWLWHQCLSRDRQGQKLLPWRHR